MDRYLQITCRRPMTKPSAEIPLFKVFMPKTVQKPLMKVLMSGYIGQGSKVEEFEKSLEKYIGNPYILTLNSGTSALHLALRLIGVKKGDEVISTPLTCTATNWPIIATGATIVWSDIDPKTANIDIESIKSKITPKTSAIMVVDWGGLPVDIDKIRKIAFKVVKGKKIKIPIIEDAAHAFGAFYKNKKVGNNANFTCFSFQAIKHLTTIDGGLLTVKNKEHFKKGKLLRWYGIDRENKNTDSRIEVDVDDWGYKFHMNDVAATIGLEQMKYVEKILKKHRKNAEYYNKNLIDLNNVILLKEPQNSVSSYWLYTIKVKNRDKFRMFMQNNGIAISQVHRRNDTHPVVKKFKTKLTNLDKFEKEMICIPVGWWVSKKDRLKIVSTIKKYDDQPR